MLNVISNNENLSVCRSCQGACCKRMPGEYHPNQWNLEDGSILNAVQSGKVSVDWWEGDVIYAPDAGELDQVYYLRPRILGASELDPSWGGTCSNLTPEGCALSFENRPYGCQVLVPNEKEPGKCSAPWSKKDAAIAWRPYQDKIKDVLSELHLGGAY